MKEIVINENDANQRLDKFLLKYLVNMPQSMLYRSLRKNCVRINEKHVRDGAYILRPGDVMRLYVKDEFFERETKFCSGVSDIEVVYEDENIILINKPCGTVVHSDDRGTKDTLLSRMQSYLYKKGEYDPACEHSFSPAFCNRLDRNTSGIIIGAKNASALRIINEKIKMREIRKLYLCIVEGELTGSGQLEAYLTRGDKKVSVSDEAAYGAKNIITKYNAIAYENGRTLLEVELETGRTHQIRAQLAHINHPLWGDKKYGSSHTDAMSLASYKLKFDFKSDAGILNYLIGREFLIEADFVKNFSHAKL